MRDRERWWGGGDRQTTVQTEERGTDGTDKLNELTLKERKKTKQKHRDTDTDTRLL